MKSFGIGSNNLLNPLFNLQVYLEAYESQQQARPIDIIVATLNLMGMKLTYDALTKQQSTEQKLYNQIVVEKTKTDRQSIRTTNEIKHHSCEFFISKHDPTKAAAIMAKEVNTSLQSDTSLIAFLATIYHSEAIEQDAFTDATKLQQMMNRRLNSLKAQSDEYIDDMVNQYAIYEQYRHEYKAFEPKDTSLVKLTQEQLDMHI